MGHNRESSVFIHISFPIHHAHPLTLEPAIYFFPFVSSSNLYVKNNIHGHYRDAYVFIHAEISSST
jgi:hypothetical protein